MKRTTHNRNAQEYIDRVQSWQITQSEQKKVQQFLNEYLSGRITSRRGNNPDALIEKVSQTLKVAVENIKSYTQKDIEKFFDNLVVNNKFKGFNQKTRKYNGKPYSDRSKIEIINNLKRYLTWRYNNPSLIKPLNIKISIKEKDIDFLTLEEINTIYKACSTNEERYIVAVLFGSGARAEEFLNIRLPDYTLGDRDDFIKLRIKNENSKTKGRTISLYYPKCFEAVNEFLDQRKMEGIKINDFVLNRGYESLKEKITTIGKRALKRNVYPHLFRHSCATWLSSKMNRQQLCIYFGWAFSSNMPDKYIQREGVHMADVDQKQKASNYQELEDKLEKSDFVNKKMKEDLEKQNQIIEQMKRENLNVGQELVKFANMIDEFKKHLSTDGK